MLFLAEPLPAAEQDPVTQAHATENANRTQLFSGMSCHCWRAVTVLPLDTQGNTHCLHF